MQPLAFGGELPGDLEAAYAPIALPFLFRFTHSEGMRLGDAPAGDWKLWLHTINWMLQDGFTLAGLVNFLYVPVQAVDGAVQRAGC